MSVILLTICFECCQTDIVCLVLPSVFACIGVHLRVCTLKINCVCNCSLVRNSELDEIGTKPSGVL